MVVSGLGQETAKFLKGTHWISSPFPISACPAMGLSFIKGFLFIMNTLLNLFSVGVLPLKDCFYVSATVNSSWGFYLGICFYNLD